MVLRVYAMWNRSKIILGILLLGYSVQAILQVVITAVFINPYTDATVSSTQVLDYSVCTVANTVIGPYFKYLVIYPTLFDLLLLVLALIPTTKESTTMYKATKRWQPNRFLLHLRGQCVPTQTNSSHFSRKYRNLLNNIPHAIVDADGDLLDPDWYLISSILWIAITFPIMPRFILSIRELYAKDTLRFCDGIDTGFGISSRVRNIAGQDTFVSAIVFVGGRSGLDEGDEEI